MIACGRVSPDHEPVTSADLDLMRRELIAAGWTQQSAIHWQAPNGALFLGPAGAWRRMRSFEEQRRS